MSDGTIRTPDLNPHFFPFAAWEFDPRTDEDNIPLTLKSPYDLEVEDDLDVGGNLSFTALYGGITTKSDNYTITDTDNVGLLLHTTGSSDYTVTLPTAADNTGRVVTIMKADSGSGELTVDGEGSETINSYTSVYLNKQYQKVIVLCDGSNWVIVGGSPSYVTGHIAIGPNEFIIPEDSELDYSSSFTDGMSAATITFTELPSSTVAILAYLYWADTSALLRFQWKRTSGGTQNFWYSNAWSDGGTNSQASTLWLPTGGNSLYVTSVYADTTSTFIICGYKTS